MLSVVRPWYEAKLFIEHATSIEHGTLHVVVGLLAWLAIVIVSRRRVTSTGPWLALLALIVWNEVVDLAIERWPHPGMQYGEGAADLLLTMLVPTVILLAARWRPAMFVPDAVCSARLDVGDDGADAMTDEPDPPASFQIEGPDGSGRG